MSVTISGDGTLTGISVGGLPDGVVDADTLATDSVTAAKLKSDAIAAGDLPAGSVLQVKHSHLADPFTASANETFIDITDLSVTLTTIGASSTFLVQVNLGMAKPKGNTCCFRVLRGSTAVGIADADGSRLRAGFRTTDYGFNDDHGVTASHAFIDSPGESAGTSLTYKLQGMNESTGNIYINRNINYGNGGESHRAVTLSSIIVTEIAA